MSLVTYLQFKIEIIQTDHEFKLTNIRHIV